MGFVSTLGNSNDLLKLNGSFLLYTQQKLASKEVTCGFEVDQSSIGNDYLTLFHPVKASKFLNFA